MRKFLISIILIIPFVFTSCSDDKEMVIHHHQQKKKYYRFSMVNLLGLCIVLRLILPKRRK